MPAGLRLSLRFLPYSATSTFFEGLSRAMRADTSRVTPTREAGTFVARKYCSPITLASPWKFSL
ncbi:hypothetical protein D3C86_2040580 [compost metagenome]